MGTIDVLSAIKKSVVESVAASKEYTNKSNTGWINAKGYGLSGDGITDNAKAFQSLLDSIDDGSVIYLPKGIYNISIPITINKKVTLIGDTVENLIKSDISTNKAESAILYTGTETNISIFTGASTQLAFENLSFYGKSFEITESGNVATTSTPSKYFNETVKKENISAITINSGFVHIRNCTFYGFSGYGISLNQHAKIVNSSFYNCNNGIVCAGYDDVIESCWFCRCAVGIYTSIQNNIFVYNTWFDQLSQHAIESEKQLMLYMQNCVIDMCDYCAIYVKTESMFQSRIDARMSRCGMYYAGTAITDIEIGERYKACCLWSHMITNSMIQVIPHRREIKTGAGICPSVIFESDGGFRNTEFNVPYSDDNTETWFSGGAGKNGITVNNGNSINKYYQAYKFDVNGVAVRSNAPSVTKFQAPNIGDFYIDSNKNNLYFSNVARGSDWRLLTAHADNDTLKEENGIISLSDSSLKTIDNLSTVSIINVMANSIANCKIDGVTDDYASLKAIIDAVKDLSTPVTLLFPNTGNSMMLSNTIEIHRSNITLKILCDIKFTKSVFSTSESMNVFVFGKSISTREPLYNVHVIGGGDNTIDANGSSIGLVQTKNTQDNEGNGIYFRRVCNSSIENIKVKNALCDGIKIYNSKNILVDSCDISETVIDNGLTVMGLPIFTSDWEYDKYADRCSNNIIIRNCTAHNNEDVGFSASVCHDVTFENCLSYENGNTDGFNAGGGFSAEILGFASYFGVSTDYDMNIIFRNCRALNNNNYGIYSDTQGVEILDCFIDKTTQNDSTTNNGRNIRGGNGIFVNGKKRIEVRNVKIYNTAYLAICFNANSTLDVSISDLVIEDCTKGVYIPQVGFLRIRNFSAKNIFATPFYICDGTNKTYTELKNLFFYNCVGIFLGKSDYIDVDNVYVLTHEGSSIAINIQDATTGIIQNVKIFKGDNTKWLTGLYVFDTCGADLVIPDKTNILGNPDNKSTDKRTTTTS